MIHSVVYGVVVSLAVLADADIDNGFPSAHASQFLVSDPHESSARIEESLDVFIYLPVDIEIRSVGYVQESVGQ